MSRLARALPRQQVTRLSEITNLAFGTRADAADITVNTFPNLGPQGAHNDVWVLPERRLASESRYTHES